MRISSRFFLLVWLENLYLKIQSKTVKKAFKKTATFTLWEMNKISQAYNSENGKKKKKTVGYAYVWVNACELYE